MSKPDDIPQDVWTKAADVSAAISAGYYGYETSHELIARAIMAEREHTEARMITWQMHTEAKAIMGAIRDSGANEPA